MSLDDWATIQMMFQSTLAIADERCSSSRPQRPAVGCFNPRSPLLTSDAKERDPWGEVTLVSIHARHC